MKQTTLEDQITIEEILEEASALGLRVLVENVAKSYIKVGLFANERTAFEAAYQDVIAGFQLSRIPGAGKLK